VKGTLKALICLIRVFIQFHQKEKAAKRMDCISFSLLIKLSHAAITAPNTMIQIPGIAGNENDQD
jgi:hypothetical protein